MSQTIEVTLMIDNTGSMKEACTAGCKTLNEVSTLMNLLNGEPCVSLSVIGDYDTSTPDNYRGGYAIIGPNATDQERSTFCNKYVRPIGGGGQPEAYKTGLNHLLLKKRNYPNNSKNIVFMFLDAVPHGYNGTKLDTEGIKEKKYIESNNMIWDWVELTSAIKNEEIHVVTFLTQNSNVLIKCWQMLGNVITISSNTSSNITKAMMWCFNVLLDQKVDKPNNLEFVNHSPLTPLIKINLLEKLKTFDAEQVLKAFDSLLDPSSSDRAADAMCLVTNPILGKYWRLICGKIYYMDDRKYSDRCQKIMNKLSQCQNKLSQTNKDILKAWIDESHNNTYEVREIVTKALKSGVNSVNNVLTLPPELASTISLDEILKLGRSGEFAEVAKLISSINMENITNDNLDLIRLPDDDDITPKFVPLNLPLHQVFGLISNLLSDGLIFSETETYLVAILSLNNKYLADMALQYLSINKGKWIKWDLDTTDTSTSNGFGKQLFPTFWSINFMRLLKLAPDDVLTPEEIEFRDRYLLIARVLKNHDATIEITTPNMFNDMRPYRTWKRLCAGCGQSRCFTIFPGNDDKCGLCLPGEIDETYTSDYRHPEKLIEKDPLKTTFAQCRTCRVNYGIVCPHHCRVTPKCHYCRMNEVCPSIECSMCLNKFINSNDSAIMALNSAQESYANSTNPQDIKRSVIIKDVLDAQKFVCPHCVDQCSANTINIEVKIARLVMMNPQLIKLIPITPYKDLMDDKVSFWKRVLKCKIINPEEKSVNIDTECMKLVYDMYKVHNSSIIAKTVVSTLTDHSGYESCSMCASEVPVSNIVDACGNCRNRICMFCVKGWYSQVEIGTLVTKGHCQCPFCKSPPKFSTFKGQKSCGLDIRHIRNLRSTKRNKGVVCEWDPRTVYGLCRDCLNLKPAMARECVHNGDLPDIKNFVCEECLNHRDQQVLNKTVSDRLNIKQCPNCQTDTQRSGGCHHITCPVEDCGAHWCWVCNKASFDDGTLFDSHTIYDHMEECGGVFPDDPRI